MFDEPQMLLDTLLAILIYSEKFVKLTKSSILHWKPQLESFTFP